MWKDRALIVEGLKLRLEITDSIIDSDVIIKVTHNRSQPIIVFVYNKKVPLVAALTVYNPKSLFGIDEENARFMLAICLRWLVDKYTQIQIVEVTDKTKIASSYGTVWAPEQMMLLQGKTYFQTYFGARPGGLTEQTNVKLFEKVHNDHQDELLKLPAKSWTEKNIVSDVLSRFGDLVSSQPQLTGSKWLIDRATILQYTLPRYKYSKSIIDLGGGGVQAKWSKPVPDFWSPSNV